MYSQSQVSGQSWIIIIRLRGQNRLAFTLQHRDEESDVMVVLHDFQSRRFQPRTPLPGEKLEPDIQAIEEAILSCAVKLNASMARNRIKHKVVSIDHLLPAAVRETEAKSNIPAYLWVNQAKSR